MSEIKFHTNTGKITVLYTPIFMFLDCNEKTKGSGLKGSKYSNSHDKPWRPTGLWDVKDPTLLDNLLTDGSKVVNPMHQLLFTPQKHYYFSASGTHFC
jgi:hypothetical protein